MSNTDRKPPCAKLTKERVRKAIPGSMGVKTRICKRLNCDWSTLNEWLKEPDWADIVAEITEEANTMVGEAVDAIGAAITQRADIGASISASKYLLNCKAGWRETTTTRLEGGDKPIQVQTDGFSMEDLESLPIETKLQILDAIEESRKKKQKAD